MDADSPAAAERSLARRWTSRSVSASGIFHRGLSDSVRYGSALCGTVLEFPHTSWQRHDTATSPVRSFQPLQDRRVLKIVSSRFL